MSIQKIAIIAAMSENRVIGQDNGLPWDLPDDLKNFKRVTAGKPFIMGRNSFESDDALLSDDRNIILSSQSDLTLPEGAEQAHTIAEAFALLQNEPTFFILGGASIFEQVLDKVNYLYLTIVHHHFTGDAFFPEIDWGNWVLVKQEEHAQDERHRYAFSMNEYQRKAV